MLLGNYITKEVVVYFLDGQGSVGMPYGPIPSNFKPCLDTQHGTKSHP